MRSTGTSEVELEKEAGTRHEYVFIEGPHLVGRTTVCLRHYLIATP